MAAKLSCPFHDLEAPAGSPSSTSGLSQWSERVTPVYNSGDAPRPPTRVADSSDDSDVNMVHLQLFNNFVTDTCQTFARTDEHLEIYRENILKSAFDYPFLMHGLLGLSALHLSIQRPNQKDFFRHLATSLQARAIAGLDNMVTHVDEKSCLTVLFFTHIIGLQSFCDAFTWEDTFGIFLSRLVHSMNLLLGVNAVIRPWWHVLVGTEMGKVLLDAETRTRPLNRGEETLGLSKLLQDADICDSTREVYQASLERLQIMLDDCKSVDGLLTKSNVAFAWLITSSPEYITLLDERRPEALVLLAYYAVILHWRRESWIIGNAGRSMFTLITTYLGQRWELWLAWPKSEIFGNSTELMSPSSTDLRVNSTP